jgi:hypothetical protein
MKLPEFPKDKTENYECKKCFLIFLSFLLMMASFGLGVHSEMNRSSGYLEYFVSGSFVCFLLSIYIIIKVNERD